jgi:cytochrome c
MSPSARRFGLALVGMALWLGATASAWRTGARGMRSSAKPGSFRMAHLIAPAVVAVIAVALFYAALLTFGRGAAALNTRPVDPAPALMIRSGCAGCHTIPGVPGARGQAGPSLAGFAGRLYVGGAETNSSGNLVRWLVNPRAVDPRTAMPVTGISEAEARAVAAYLLRQH